MELSEKIIKGNVFVYPTDTVYGLGCDATNSDSVNRIKDMKGRDRDKPISIIAPSLSWIEENCVVDYDLSKYLPGPYTLILKKKDSGFLSDVAPGETLGVRIPDSDFCDEVREVGIPFVTTSVNLSGEPPAVAVEEVSSEILEKVDEIVDEGKLNGKPSTLVMEASKSSKDDSGPKELKRG